MNIRVLILLCALCSVVQCGVEPSPFRISLDASKNVVGSSADNQINVNFGNIQPQFLFSEVSEDGSFYFLDDSNQIHQGNIKTGASAGVVGTFTIDCAWLEINWNGSVTCLRINPVGGGLIFQSLVAGGAVEEQLLSTNLGKVEYGLSTFDRNSKSILFVAENDIDGRTLCRVNKDFSISFPSGLLDPSWNIISIAYDDTNDLISIARWTSGGVIIETAGGSTNQILGSYSFFYGQGAVLPHPVGFLLHGTENEIFYNLISGTTGNITQQQQFELLSFSAIPLEESQSTSQDTSQSTGQDTSQSASQDTSQSVSQDTSQNTQSESQSTSPSTSQDTMQDTSQNTQSESQSTSPSASPSTSQDTMQDTSEESESLVAGASFVYPIPLPLFILYNLVGGLLFKDE